MIYIEEFSAHVKWTIYSSVEFWDELFSFEIKVEGHKVTLPMCYTDKRQPYKCSVSFLFLNVNPQQVFMSRASKRDLCHLLNSYEGEIKNEQNLVKEVF